MFTFLLLLLPVINISQHIPAHSCRLAVWLWRAVPRLSGACGTRLKEAPEDGFFCASESSDHRGRSNRERKRGREDCIQPHNQP
uniref:Putative secreted protein n=1 Tax=Anopheles darlingi TaxID=43151 RepID=A0A2M4DDF8_ANODA